MKQHPNVWLNAVLINEKIEEACEKIEAFLRTEGLDNRDALRIKLAAEETLLTYQKKFGPGYHFQMRCVKQFGRLRIEIMVQGEPVNPYTEEEETGGEILRTILAGMDNTPIWRYKNGKNCIVFTPVRKKNRSEIVNLLLTAALAFVCGSLCMPLPEEMRLFISCSVVSPLFDTAIGLLVNISGPMIFLTVINSICNIGDIATLSKIGKRMISRFISISFLLSAFTLLIYLPFYSVTLGNGGKFDFTDLYKMVLDIVPSNFLTPFLDGNLLQIIFMAVLIGIALLTLGSKVEIVANFIGQANDVIQFIMGMVNHLVPVFIFLSLFNMVLSGSVSVLKDSYRLFPMLILGIAFVMAVYVVVVCIRKHISPMLLIQKLLPTYLIGLSTASSSAALQKNLDTCEKSLGISRKLVSFGVPLGQVIFMVGAAVEYLNLGMCMGDVYQVPMTLSWLLNLWLLATMMAIANPPVPGGGLSCLTLLATQLGLPKEAMAIMIAFSVISDFFSTSCNLWLLQCELIELAGGLDLIDLNVLRSAPSEGY